MTSGSLTTTQGLTPCCSRPSVGSSSTTKTAPRPSLILVPTAGPLLVPSEPACQRCYRLAPQYLPRASRGPMPQVPARRVRRFRGGDSEVIAQVRPACDDPVRGGQLRRRTCCGSFLFC